MITQLTGDIKNVAVKIKLKRLGKIRNPQYRVVIANSRTARDGRSIEEIGLYHPKEEPSLIQINSERVQYWLGVGAQPTEPVLALLKITGDWQKFKGLPGSEGTLKVAPPKVDKNTVFAQTVQAVANEPRTPTIRPKVEQPAPEVKAEEVKAEEAVTSQPAEATSEEVVRTAAEVADESGAAAPADTTSADEVSAEVVEEA